MSDRFMDMVNRSPVTFGVLGLYLLFALLTDGMAPPQLFRYGAAIPALIMDGEPWRLITHCFLHGGILHLAVNAYALFLLGQICEHRLGSLKFAILYLVAGVTGGIAAVLWQMPVGMMVGGSGALFGMMGAILASNLRAGRTFSEVMNHPGTRQILILLAINLGIGFLLPMISNSAHIGGLLGGFIVTFCFLDRGRFKTDATSRMIQVGWIALLLSLLFYTMFPVLRWDYNMKLALRAREPQVAAAYERAANQDRSLVRWLTGSTEYDDPIVPVARETLSQVFPYWDDIVARWEKGN